MKTLYNLLTVSAVLAGGFTIPTQAGALDAFVSAADKVGAFAAQGVGSVLSEAATQWRSAGKARVGGNLNVKLDAQTGENRAEYYSRVSVASFETQGMRVGGNATLNATAKAGNNTAKYGSIVRVASVR